MQMKSRWLHLEDNFEEPGRHTIGIEGDFTPKCPDQHYVDVDFLCKHLGFLFLIVMDI